MGYIRVSSQEQADSGLSLEEQERVIRDAATRHGYELQEIYTDAGLSGGLRAHQRDGLADALAALPRRGALIVQKRDRLGRDMYEMALVERLAKERKALIVSATEENTHGDPDDPGVFLMRGMTDLIAHYERLTAKMRMRAAHRARKARGEVSGFVEFGKREGANKKIELDPAEQEVIRAVVACRDEGLSQREIVAELKTSNIVSPRSGKALRLVQVQRILKRYDT